MQSTGILVIDREEAVRESLCFIISEEGFHCFASSDKEEALAILETEPIGLITIDSQLLSSSKLLEIIADKYPAVKIIIISSYTEIDVTQRALMSGADDFIVKPIDFEELIGKLDTHLSGSSQ